MDTRVFGRHYGFYGKSWVDFQEGECDIWPACPSFWTNLDMRSQARMSIFGLLSRLLVATSCISR
jgi:hypothetical protein